MTLLDPAGQPCADPATTLHNPVAPLRETLAGSPAGGPTGRNALAVDPACPLTLQTLRGAR